jgi:hypothetical protein
MSSFGVICAQDWSREDSLWLMNVLEGREEFKINEDTKKAIEEGRLIAPSWMLDSNNKLKNIELMKDLDDAGAIDSARISIDPYSMPPAVYALYVLYIDKMDSIYENKLSMITPSERKKLEEALPPSARDRFYVSQDQLGRLSGGVGGHDFNHILSMIFSPYYRLLVHNGKYATSYKNYYDEGAIIRIGFTEGERRQMRQALRNVKVTYEKRPGQRMNTIDD